MRALDQNLHSHDTDENEPFKVEDHRFLTVYRYGFRSHLELIVAVSK